MLIGLEGTDELWDCWDIMSVQRLKKYGRGWKGTRAVREGC